MSTLFIFCRLKEKKNRHVDNEKKLNFFFYVSQPLAQNVKYDYCTIQHTAAGAGKFIAGISDVKDEYKIEYWVKFF